MRLDLRCYALWVLLAAQLIFMAYYLLVAGPLSRPHPSTRPWPAISFISHPYVPPRKHSGSNMDFPTAPIFLAGLGMPRTKYFASLNGTNCFLPGTDIGFSKRFSKCQCHPGWHGPDCGMPEVIWRAFIAARHKELPRRRDKPRRVVCAVVTRLEASLTEIFIEELTTVVDLFLLGSTDITKSLLVAVPQSVQHKVFPIVLTSEEKVTWQQTRQSIPDLRHDDLVVFMGPDQIPSSKALLFLKLYDGWPQPVAFRLRWSVYGFFWQHPTRTVLAGRACSAGTLARQYRDDLTKLQSSEQNLLVVGDLNHYGGWQCSWCLQSPRDIIIQMQSVKPTDWDLSSRKIDTTYVEELISNGLWVDGRTQLLRSSQSRDAYFAPDYVLNNSLKYDFLLQNIYANFDY